MSSTTDDASAKTPVALKARVAEWFLRRDALAVAATQKTLSPEGVKELRRARIVANVADRIIQDVPDEEGGDEAVLVPALSLHREALFRLGCIFAEPAGAPRSLPEAWAALPLEGIAAKAGPEAVERTKSAIVDEAPDALYAASSDSLKGSLKAARAVARSALAAGEARVAPVTKEKVRRIVRIASGVLVLGLALVGLWFGGREVLFPDRAKSAHWTSSSGHNHWATSGVGVAPPPLPGVYYFLYTEEEDHPWILFDLGAPRSVGTVTIDSLTHCCRELILPLVVKVGDSPEDLHVVARSETEFQRWNASFSRQKARFVKIEVDRKSQLLLTSVAIR